MCTCTDTSYKLFNILPFAVCSVKEVERHGCSVQTGKWQLYLWCVKCALLLQLCALVVLQRRVAPVEQS